MRTALEIGARFAGKPSTSLCMSPRLLPWFVISASPLLVVLLQILPALMLVAGMGLMPESPRWLMAVGREAAARGALLHIRKSNALNVLQEVRRLLRKNC